MGFDRFDDDTEAAVRQFLFALADDDFVVGHRYSDWVAIGPTMEEDNALASISQDELGHARLWYELLADAEDGADADLDDLALNRPADERRNSVLVEPRQESFADAVVVNYLYDEAEVRLLESLRDGTFDAASARAEQALREEGYHRDHAREWLERLVATEEARSRVEESFESALEDAADLFEFGDVSAALVDSGVLSTAPDALCDEWVAAVRSTVESLELDVDVVGRTERPVRNGRQCEHTESLESMVDEMHADNLVGSHPVRRERAR